MNERLKELAVQAKIQMVSEPRLEEFAELIINACCCMMLRMEEKYPANLMAKQIKQYYGVEE